MNRTTLAEIYDIELEIYDTGFINKVLYDIYGLITHMLCQQLILSIFWMVINFCIGSYCLEFKERKNRVRIRLFSSSSFIVLNRLNVFCM
jgi:hypothetical protein